MHTEMHRLMQRALDDELNDAELRRLQDHLRACDACAREWDALTQVQRVLAAAPLLAPANGFAERALERIVAHRQAQAHRPSIAPFLVFALGSLAVLAFSLVGSPLSELLVPDAWASLLSVLIALTALLSTWLEVALAFARVTLTLLGDGPLFVIALLTIALTVFWARIVAGAPLTRPLFVSGGSR